MDLRTTPATDRNAGAGDTLARRLEQGPLPLGEALLCARDVANHLRELHEDGRAHGEVGPRLVILRRSGSVLMPPAAGPSYANSLADVVAFGTMFYEMLTSRKPTTETLLSTPLQGPPRKGPGAVQAAAVRLAERCLTAAPESGPSMQKVLTELRLLTVQARQWESHDEAAPAGAAAPAKPSLPAKKERKPAELPAGLDDPEAEGGAELVRAAEQPVLDVHAGESAESSDEPEEEEEDPLADGKCPRCRCSKVRLSRPRNRLERLLAAIGLPVRRCHRCYFRYIDLFKACLEMPAKKFNR